MFFLALGNCLRNSRSASFMPFGARDASGVRVRVEIHHYHAAVLRYEFQHVVRHISRMIGQRKWRRVRKKTRTFGYPSMPHRVGGNMRQVHQHSRRFISCTTSSPNLDRPLFFGLSVAESAQSSVSEWVSVI